VGLLVEPLGLHLQRLISFISCADLDNLTFRFDASESRLWDSLLPVEIRIVINRPAVYLNLTEVLNNLSEDIIADSLPRPLLVDLQPR